MKITKPISFMSKKYKPLPLNFLNTKSKKPLVFDLVPKQIWTTGYAKKTIKNPNKNLTYPQSQKKFGLSPFGDYDKDFRINMFDCRPFDPMRHKVPAGQEERVAHSYTKSATWKEIWSEAERDMPRSFKGDEYEDLYSDMLERALVKREDVKETSFKDVVGTHEVDLFTEGSNVAVIQDYIHNYLVWEFPDWEFIFDPSQPKYVTAISPEGVETKGVKVSKYIKESAPKQIRDLTTQLGVASQKIKVDISDYPVDVLKKSTYLRKGEHTEGKKLAFGSCETLGPYAKDGGGHGIHHEGPFADIAEKNAVAFIYLEGNEPGRDIPSGRIQLRWTHRADGTPDIGIEPLAYPWKEEGGASASAPYIDAVQRLLNAKGYATHISKTPYCHEGWSDMGGGAKGSRIEYRPYPAYNPGKPTYESTEKYKQQMLKRKKIPAPFLYQFSMSADPYVKTTLASKQNIPKSLIYKYSREPIEDVRRAILQREDLPTQPVDVLKQMLKDSSRRVRDEATIKALRSKRYELLNSIDESELLESVEQHRGNGFEIDETLGDILLGKIMSSGRYQYLFYLPKSTMKKAKAEILKPELIKSINEKGRLSEVLSSMDLETQDYKKIVDMDHNGYYVEKVMSSLPDNNTEDMEKSNDVIQYIIRKLPEETVARLLMNKKSSLYYNADTVKVLLSKTTQPQFVVRYLMNEHYGDEESDVQKVLFNKTKNMLKETGTVIDEQMKNYVIETLTILKGRAISSTLRKDIDLVLKSLQGE